MLNLIEGSKHSDDTSDYVLASVPLEDVLLPTGRVIACDPLVFADDTPPFTVTVEPGRYRLRGWVATVYRDGAEVDRRTAALQLVVRDEPAVRWEPALLPGQDVAALGPDQFYGYPVDAGCGTFADEVAIRALAEWEYEQLEDVYIPAQLPPAPCAIGAVTDEATGANVVSVSTGWGDGAYPTYVGRTAEGKVACFVTDFQLF